MQWGRLLMGLGLGGLIYAGTTVLPAVRDGRTSTAELAIIAGLFFVLLVWGWRKSRQ